MLLLCEEWPLPRSMTDCLGHLRAGCLRHTPVDSDLLLQGEALMSSEDLRGGTGHSDGISRFAAAATSSALGELPPKSSPAVDSVLDTLMSTVGN